MGTDKHVDGATYVVAADGRLQLSTAGADVQARYQEALAQHQALAACWTGACLARLFRRHAWLDAVTLSFAVTAEYDDSGGYYRCVSCHAEKVRAVPGAVMDEEIFPGGEFDADHAAMVLREEIEDDEFDLYTGLAGAPDGYDNLELPLERRAIADLLLREAIDGQSACVAWGLPRGLQS